MNSIERREARHQGRCRFLSSVATVIVVSALVATLLTAIGAFLVFGPVENKLSATYGTTTAAEQATPSSADGLIATLDSDTLDYYCGVLNDEGVYAAFANSYNASAGEAAAEVSAREMWNALQEYCGGGNDY